MSKSTKYKHVYFDLDNTLWDFDANCYATFCDIFEQYNLIKDINSVKNMYNVYNYYNEQLWEFYRKGEIKKERLRTLRFELTLKEFGIEDLLLAEKIGRDYLEFCPLKNIMVPNAFDVLQYLHGRYNLYILTNGFEETQQKKMKNCGLDRYFKKMISSESIKIQKPRREIFEYALKTVNARALESIMIGDHLEVDIIGAKKVGMDQVYFNKLQVSHNENVTYEIFDLSELKTIL